MDILEWCVRPQNLCIIKYDVKICSCIHIIYSKKKIKQWYVNIIKESFEDNKGVIESRRSTDRQHNTQNKKDSMANNDIQNVVIVAGYYSY